MCYNEGTKKGKVIPMANKPTKIEQYNKILPYISDNAELVAFVNAEIENVRKKNARRSDKPTARQAENEGLMPVIYEAMEAEKQYTVSDLIAEIPALNGLSTQRVAPIMTKMVENVLVAHEKVKGKSYYTKI
jgi:hypothetical protein